MAKNSVTKSHKGGGPQTEEGKKITSRNALKTGAYSNTLILPGEDESEFRQIEEQFIHDFDPRDMAEIAMVRDLAILAWKKVRLENVELRFTLDRLDRPMDHLEEHQFSLLSSKEAKYYLADPSGYSPQYEEDIEQAILLAEKMIESLSVQALTEKELKSLKISCPMLWEDLTMKIKHSDCENPTLTNILRYMIINYEGDEQLFLDGVFRRHLDYYQDELRVCLQVDEIRKQSQALQDQRLMALMENPKSSRAFDDLRRNFYRTLTELRKHQEWRRKMRGMDLDDQAKTIEEGGKE